MIAARIRRMNLDELAVQEVEDTDSLRFFDAQELDHSYSFMTFVGGNDESPALAAGASSAQLILTKGPAQPDLSARVGSVRPRPAAGRCVHRSQEGAFIDRRTLHTGDGSDHDPARVVLASL
ncbi:hypothetical protein ACTPOK_40525 [Streptomyces inhibens]|uniref:hypothetical protein n=1 Tax=Streptomyces inhibens TaxID=2293571 RepID=UPI00402AD959